MRRLIVGLFVALVIAWYHGDQGRQRVSGAELLIIAGLLALGGLGLGLLSGDKSQYFDGGTNPAMSRETIAISSDDTTELIKYLRIGSHKFCDMSPVICTTLVAIK